MGASGMLGHVTYFYLRNTQQYKMYNTVFRNKLTEDSITCNVRDLEKIGGIINKIKPDILVNCVGALVNESKKDAENTIFLNSLLPYFLKQIFNENGGKLIQISTDCVFSGRKGNYREDDFKDADDVYGRSKALGEIVNDRDVTIRTSIIGPELKENGEGLFHWLMNQSGVISGFSKVIWGGVTTYELAKSVQKVIDENLTGLFNVTNGVGISKYELIKLIIKEFELDQLTVEKFEKYSVNKSLQKSERYSFNIPTYDKMIEEMHHFVKSNIQLYPHYFEKE